jgi:formate hydrogenlyase subunit 6/NADH:ubiquinone oxidoreductase subunit I
MPSFVSSVMSQYDVLGPVAKEHKFAFAPVTDAAQLRLDYNTSILPPKKALLPQEETLFTFKTDGSFSARPVFDVRPRVVFGVHTCDLHAMKLIDAVFVKGYPDAHYLKRRENTVIVGIECLTPCDEHSFCKSMGTLSASEGYDVHLTDLGDAYAADVATSAGEALFTRHAQAREATNDDIARMNKVLSEKWPRFQYKLDFDANELPSLMAVSYKSPLWEELGNKCLACGQCTLVCPTCYCFNVVDMVGLDGKSGERKRIWDSCQLDEFARIGSGENFRKTRAQRQRHRFFRKGKYLPDNHGELGCVGCGRCARACLVDITPVDVFNALYKARG